MLSILSVIRLIRFKNLVIIALTLYLMRYAIVQPILVIYGLSLEFPFVYFNLIALSILLIAAAGYMINDYFDVKIDTINRPDKVIVDKFFSANAVFYAYIILNLMALIITGYISYRTNHLKLFAIYPVTIGALWFYSTIYKKQLLIGNIIVGLVTAIVPILPALYEIPFVNAKYRDYLMQTNLDIKIILAWTGSFAFFAFFINILREIIKDAEDFEGDNSVFRNTLPIVLGMRITKLIIYIIISIVILALGILYDLFLRVNDDGTIDFITLLYFLVLIIIPLLITAVIIFKAKTPKMYSKAALIVKCIIITGIAYSIVVRIKLL